MKSEKELKRLLSDGFINNVIHYDEGARRTITKRLLYLIWGHCEDDVDYFIIPTDVYPDFNFAEKVYGAWIVRDKRLNRGGPILKHYEKLGATLPIGKEGIIIACGKKNMGLGAV